MTQSRDPKPLDSVSSSDRSGRAISEPPLGSRAVSNSLEPGIVFADRYRVGKMLGSGAMGNVFAAKRISDGLDVALKVIHPPLVNNRQVSQRFHREAKILAALKGKHIVSVHELGEDSHGLLFMALDLVDGVSLDTLIKSRAELPIRAVVDIMCAVCEALDVAHAAGVVHRDLKPGNVMVRMDGDTVSDVCVLDFGLSKVLQKELGSTNLTEQNMVLGTPEYMSPEQARGDDVDGRADVYAAGIMLYELLAGRVPFVGRTLVALMTAHLTQPPPPISETRAGEPIAPALAAAISFALAKARHDRYPSANAFADALRASLVTPTDPLSVHPPPLERDSLPYRDTEYDAGKSMPVVIVPPASLPPPTTRTPPQVSRSRQLWIILAIVATLVGVALGIAVAQRF